MGCGCGGGSETVFSPSAGSRPATPEEQAAAVAAGVPLSSTYPHVPVSARPGRVGVPIPDWLPQPAGEPAVPTHEKP